MAVAAPGVSWIKVVRSGLLAGLAQTAAVYVLSVVLGSAVSDMSTFVGGVLVGPTAAAVGVGRWLFALMALVWAFVYRRTAHALPGTIVQRGLLFGALVWAFSTGLLLPLLSLLVTDGPSPGFFGFGFGGASAALTSLTAHLVYGTVLASTMPTDVRQPVPETGPA